MEYPITEEEEKQLQPQVTKLNAIGASAAEAWVEYKDTQAKIKKTKKEGERLFIAAAISFGIGWLFEAQGFKYFAGLCFLFGVIYPYLQCRDLERRLERINEKIDRFAYDWSLMLGGDKAIRVDLPRHVVLGSDDSGHHFFRDSPEFQRWLINHRHYLYWSLIGHQKGDALNEWEEKWYEKKFGEEFKPYTF